MVSKNGYPFPIGHEWASTFVKIGKDVKNFKVSGLGADSAFAEYAIRKEAPAVKLSDGIDPKYVLGEPLKCIIAVLEVVAPKADDYGVFIGSNQWLFRLFGAEAVAELGDPNNFGGEVKPIRSKADQEIPENDLPYAANSRDIGPAEMA